MEYPKIYFRKFAKCIFAESPPNWIRVAMMIGRAIANNKIIIFLRPVNISLKVPTSKPKDEKKKITIKRRRIFRRGLSL